MLKDERAHQTPEVTAAAPEPVIPGPEAHHEAVPAEATHDSPTPRPGGYWYQDSGHAPSSVDVLNLLRRYRESERKMRSRTRESMSMGETDLLALRFVLRAQSAGELLRQRDLAQELDISAASVSVLVDRLIRYGYVRRVPFPSDRRSVAIEPTIAGDQEVRETLSEMHRRMIETVETLTEAERAAVTKFLLGLIASVD
ncbi:MarR family winged helix-turn-helix transcriptional regulator [Nesterenkonia sp. DZ6]|uniref:MarR family winged helix-turn-helix transcriptional regulator n=1 Tax=Nesterenkonia sp. DZ6 TaxID=2901229 RepID=UPI001F4D233F|nr:MarR family transcriptional regulator [Nesterenkonia sp. DZ6]MCH8560201.1 MarR family transcriptional regulator [Nesterenkonia sp. DZ6]